MPVQSLLTLQDLSEAQLVEILDRSVELADAFGAGRVPRVLDGRRIALINDDRGWRNTAALDLGAQLLGATCTPVPVSLGGGEAIADLAGYLGNWFDLIAIRSRELDRMTELAAAAAIPVLNLRTRQNHPCETLGDLSFLHRQGRQVRGLSVVALAPAGNILHSWAEAASITGLRLTQIAPVPYWIDRGRYPSARIACTEEPGAVIDADVVITDCWPDGADHEAFAALRVTGAVLDRLGPDCLFIPCPPVTRGQEVADDAMGHPKCVATAAKAHLLHAQNACLTLLLGA